MNVKERIIIAHTHDECANAEQTVSSYRWGVVTSFECAKTRCHVVGIYVPSVTMWKSESAYSQTRVWTGVSFHTQQFAKSPAVEGDI